MIPVSETLHQLRREIRTYVRSFAPDIVAFCGSALFADHAERRLAPKPTAISNRLTQLRTRTVPHLMPVVEAIILAAPHLNWRQSYTVDDPGIDDHHIANYAWFNLIAPSGPFVSENLRVSVGYWEQGLTYPRHWHEPEEIYLTLAGSAEYISEGRAAVRGGPGTTICHYSNQPHAANFADAPLLAAAFWRGNGLEAKSVLEP